MESKAGMIVRVLKRLKAAVGYHELGMTQHALRCLDSLASLGKIGPFGLVTEVLRGEFVKDRENHISAAKALEIVACMLPTPARSAIEMTLAACFGQGNDVGRAANSVARARGAKHSSTTVNNPRTVLAHTADLNLTGKQTQWLEKMVKSGKQRAAFVLTQAQRKQLAQIIGIVPKPRST